MSKQVFDRIRAGCEDALAIARGDFSRCAGYHRWVRRGDVPDYMRLGWLVLQQSPLTAPLCIASGCATANRWSPQDETI